MKSVIVSLLVIITIISLSKTTETAITNNGNKNITIELHHPDLSPISPRYDPSLSHYQRVANALQTLSPNLHRRRNLQTTPVFATVENTGGNYLVTYAIGTPPITVKGTFDTGRDLLWTSCNKLMMGKWKSSSLRNISCNSPMCRSFPERDHSCTTAASPCSYDVKYPDGSSNKGSFSTETITLGSVKFTNIAFGCESGSKSGSLGLGGGAVSLVRQLIPVGIKPHFAYCLVSIRSDRSTSKLHLGVAVQGTPIRLVSGIQTPTSYYVRLDSITVGGQNPMSFGKNVILETGTMMTQLPPAFYNSLIRALTTTLGKTNVKDPNFDLCYSILPAPDKFPNIRLKFGTANVVWKQENLFAPLGPKLWCLAASPIEGDDQEAVIGSLGQVNFLVGFDLTANTVTLQPTDCGRSN